MLCLPMPSVGPVPTSVPMAVAGRAVAVLLRALEAFGVDGQHGDAFLRRHAAADGLHVVADHAHDAGRVDEGRLGLVVVDQFDERLVELLRAAEDHVLLLQVGGEAQPVQFRARGERAADVPGVGRAADRAVDEVHGVGDRVEHHPRSAEDARPLAHRAGQARLVRRPCRTAAAPFSWTCGLASFEDFDHGWSAGPCCGRDSSVMVHRTSDL